MPTSCKKESQVGESKKQENDMPIFSHIENMFNEYNISTVAYYNGKLNGVNCQELNCLAKSIFLQLKHSSFLLLMKMMMQ
jgi:hypothetical protein